MMRPTIKMWPILKTKNDKRTEINLKLFSQMDILLFVYDLSLFLLFFWLYCQLAPVNSECILHLGWVRAPNEITGTTALFHYFIFYLFFLYTCNLVPEQNNRHNLVERYMNAECSGPRTFH